MDTKHCIVCGAGSTRADWQDQAEPACDSHSAEEISAAKASHQDPEPEKPKESLPEKITEVTKEIAETVVEVATSNLGATSGQ